MSEIHYRDLLGDTQDLHDEYVHGEKRNMRSSTIVSLNRMKKNNDN